MQPPPTARPSGTKIFALVAIAALGSTIVATGLGSGAHRHLVASRALIRGHENAGPTAAPALPALAMRRADLAEADRSLASGDRFGASVHLANVLAAAYAIDRQDTLVTSVVASSLVDDVTKRIDADPLLLDQPEIAAALRHVSLGSARHPLRSEREHALTMLSKVPSEVTIPTAGFVDWKTANAMDDVDVALRKMETAALANDVAACETAANSTTGLAKQVMVGPPLCAFASRVVASNNHLRDLRARAATRSLGRLRLPPTRL